MSDHKTDIPRWFWEEWTDFVSGRGGNPDQERDQLYAWWRRLEDHNPGSVKKAIRKAGELPSHFRVGLAEILAGIPTANADKCHLCDAAGLMWANFTRGTGEACVKPYLCTCAHGQEWPSRYREQAKESTDSPMPKMAVDQITTAPPQMISDMADYGALGVVDFDRAEAARCG